MTSMGTNYMPLDRQLFDRSIAEALADLLAQKYGTAKQLARAVGISLPTAENLRKGHLGVTTLQAVMKAEGRGLWDQLGDELFGETFYEFEERRIEAAIREAEGVRSNIRRLRAQSEELLAGAGLLDAARLGPSSVAVGGKEGASRGGVDQEGDRETSRARSGGAA